MHTHPYECTRTHPTLMRTDQALVDLEIDEVINGVLLLMGMPTLQCTHSTFIEHFCNTRLRVLEIDEVAICVLLSMDMLPAMEIIAELIPAVNLEHMNN